VELDVGRLHLVRNPRPVLAGTGGLRAGIDDLRESDVHREREPPFRPPRALEPLRNPERFLRQHEPGIGRVPQDGLPFRVPGEDPLRVTRQESLGAQVSPDGEEPVLGMLDGREQDLVVEKVDGHEASNQAQASAGSGSFFGLLAGSTENVSFSESNPMVTVPPFSSSPKRISSVNGSRISAWMSRASGRAPYLGS
jgi:hypothetical protein